MSAATREGLRRRVRHLLLAFSAVVLGARIGVFPSIDFHLRQRLVKVIRDTESGQLTEVARGSGRRGCYPFVAGISRHRSTIAS